MPLGSAEFEAIDTQFFANPHESVRGWERAAEAQDRILRAVRAIASAESQPGNGGSNYLPLILSQTKYMAGGAPLM
jgi:hypothetical protein